MKAAATVLSAFVLMVTVGTKVFGQSDSTLKPNDKGNYLYHACKTFLKNVDDKGPATDQDYADFMYCAGYLDGFTGSYQWYATESKGYCTDVNTSNGVMIRVYVRYMENNPKLMDAPTVVGLAKALRENYPCNHAADK